MAWQRGAGLDGAQLWLRGRYDADLDGTMDEPLAMLFQLGDPMAPAGVKDASVRVRISNANRLAIEVDVQTALESIRAAYVKAGVL